MKIKESGLNNSHRKPPRAKEYFSKKLIKSLSFVMCMLFAMLTVPFLNFETVNPPPVENSVKGPSAGPTGLWSDFASGSFADGSGSSGSPYLISTAEELANLSGKSTSSYYQLIADINLEEHFWVPIVYFYRNFDGGGYTISNMTISGSYEYAGFVGRLQSNSSIQNVTFRKANVSSSYNGSRNLGVVAGYSASTITQCAVYDSDISNSDSTSSPYIGGITGYTYSVGIITQCSVYNSSISSLRGMVGGIVGMNYYTTITQCSVYNSTISSGNSTSSPYIGGITGYSQNYKEYFVSITQCTVYNSTISSGNSTSSPYIGGITGRCFSSSSYSPVIITHCYVLNVEITATSSVTIMKGGLIGGVSYTPSLSNCYISNVTSDDSAVTSFYVGGSPTTSELYNDNDPTYNLNVLTSIIGSLGATGTTNGWDESIWGVKSYINGGKPYLKWMFWEA